MIAQVRTLFRYRLLIQSLVARELKARYRGSVLGFFWSFVNPLLLLLTYWLVFTYMLPGVRAAEHRALLPVPLLRHPALDLVPVLAARSPRACSSRAATSSRRCCSRPRCCRWSPCSPTWSTSCSACPSCCCSSLWNGQLSADARCCCPLPMLVQLVFTLGLALFVSALTVHFRDIQNILAHLLHLWFFATPVLYVYADETGRMRAVLRFNPMTHVLVSYQEMLFDGHFRPLARACSWPRWPRSLTFAAGRLPLRPAARHPGGGGVTRAAAVVARDVAKVYRRFLHQNQFRP